MTLATVLPLRPDDPPPPGDIHDYLGRTDANYLVIPRTLLQSMPSPWQETFVRHLTELDQSFEHVKRCPVYRVTPAIEKDYSELDEIERAELGIEIVDEVEDTSRPVYRDQDGETHKRWHRVLVDDLNGDPVPHYDWGRTYVVPREVA